MSDIGFAIRKSGTVFMCDAVAVSGLLDNYERLQSYFRG